MDILLRPMSLFFDRIVYNLIPDLYELFIEISGLSVLSNSSIEEFASRIYALIGVFMLFKVTFSLIALLANPDAINDSKKGLGGIVKRVMISLVLVSFVPFIFSFVFKVQEIVLEHNVLANIILGGNYSTVGSITDVPGDAIAYGILSSFIHPSDDYIDWAKKEEVNFDTEDADLKKVYESYRTAQLDKDVDGLIDIANEKEDGDYIFSYTSFASTLAGIFACYTFVIYLIQLGFRSVKLAFLQLIAPIPILSYVDPKSSEKTFKAWVKECTSTFLDIFIRLIIIYFVVLIISIITDGGYFNLYHWGSDEKANPSFLASAFVIIGLLMFAMEAPKLIPQMLGMSSSGNFSLNPLKALGGGAGLVGTLAGMGVGFAGAAIAGGVSNAANAIRSKDTSLGKGFMSTLGGVAGGARHGLMAGFRNKGKGSPFKAIKQGREASNQMRYNRMQWNKAGYGFMDRMSDRFTKWYGGKNEYGGTGLMDKELEQLRNQAAEYDTRENRSREQMTDFELKYAQKYGAQTFETGFMRDKDGNLEFDNPVYAKDKDGKPLDDYHRYLKYMNEINAARYKENKAPIATITDEKIFEQYQRLESNTNYYNQAHENIKKEIKTREKTIKTLEQAKNTK